MENQRTGREESNSLYGGESGRGGEREVLEDNPRGKEDKISEKLEQWGTRLRATTLHLG